MSDFWQTLLIASIPSIITGFVSYLVVRKNYKTEIDKIKEDFKSQMTLLDKKMNNNIAENTTSKLVASIIDNPEMQKKMSQAIKNAPMKQRRHK